MGEVSRNNIADTAGGSMQRIFGFRTEEKHLDVPVVFVWCFDPRFLELRESWLRSKAIRVADFIAVAGGAKGLSDGEDGGRFLLNQIVASIRLHHPEEVVLMMHDDCGACGGNRDRGFYEKELMKARENVRKFLAENGLSARIRCIFADFDGIWEA